MKQNKKIKLLKEYEEAYNKVDGKDIDKVFEKTEEIFKITKGFFIIK